MFLFLLLHLLKKRLKSFHVFQPVVTTVIGRTTSLGSFFFTTMAVFQLRSSNPDLGFIIGKKPPTLEDGKVATDMPLKACVMRDGRCYGWYSHDGKVDGTTYNVMIDGVSYGQVAATNRAKQRSSSVGGRGGGGGGDKYGYIDPSQYCSPYALLDCLSEMFSSAFRDKPHKLDIPKPTVQHRFWVGLLHIGGQATLLQRYARLLGFTLRLHDPLQSLSKQLEEGAEVRYGTMEVVKEGGTLAELLSFVYVVGLMLVMSVEKPDSLDAGMFDHGVRLLAQLRAPYSIVRQFATRATRRERLFYTNKPALEKILLAPAGLFKSIKLCFGNAAQQRRSFILNQLHATTATGEKQKMSEVTFERDIVDCGCGPGDYAIPYSRLIVKQKQPVNYHAIDVDLEALKELKQKIAKHFTTKDLISPIVIYDSMEGFYAKHDLKKEVDVIVTEMVEHLEQKEAATFLTTTIKRLNFKRMIVTTPNFEFNRHLNMNTQYRHPDHKYELTKKEFHEFILQCLQNSGKQESIKVAFYGIGDQLDDDSITQCAILSSS
jgi:small RNA 2'-O-methyltransferase